jgi:hypothetical protein
MTRAICAAVSIALAASPAWAAPDEAAFRAYVDGQYEAAAAAAAKAGGAENLALAARALNAVAYFDEGRKTARKAAASALDYAEAAIDEDPRLPEAHLQAAISLGLKGSRMAPLRAFMAGIASKTRQHLDAALELDPKNPWALSTSAAWRLEVARRGGGAVYGAVPEDGETEFEAARAVAPGNIVIAYECALRLLASERPEWRAEALRSLEDALAAAPSTVFEKRVHGRAEELTAAVAQGPGAVRAFVREHP